MKINRIVTNRMIDPHHANDLVYEWEDDLRDYFGTTLFYNHVWKNERYSKYIPLVLNWLQTNEPAFTYEMCVYRHNGNNKRNIVPCLIDFYLRKPWQVKLWYYQYWRNPVICVSSREVYQYLTEELALTKIKHLPLSIYDRYRITENTRFTKHYDLLLAGRQNAVLKDFLNQYIQGHPEFTYIRRDIINGKSVYVDQNGKCISSTDSREIYIQMLQQARTCLYATPGMDGGRQTNGFNQVTPRFLEIIVCGCHPIMRYPKNADTDYFDLSSFGPHIDSYAQFEVEMDKARQQLVEMKKHAEYMKSHYTSVVAKQLEQILASI